MKKCLELGITGLKLNAVNEFPGNKGNVYFNWLFKCKQFFKKKLKQELPEKMTFVFVMVYMTLKPKYSPAGKWYWCSRHLAMALKQA